MRKKVAVRAAAAGMAAVLLLGAMSCAARDAVQAAKAIAAYLPVVTALANDAAAVAAAIDAEDAPLIQQVNTKVRAELTELAKVSAAYVAAPTADNWTRLGAVMDELVNNADTGLLATSGIKNAESQARAKVALAALDAAVHVLDGYLAAARTPQQTKAAVALRHMKLATVTRAWSEADWQRADTQTKGRARAMAAMAATEGY